MTQPTECRNIPVYEELNQLIFEYLELNGLEKTMGSFEAECKAKFLPCPQSPQNPEDKSAFSNYEAEGMMDAFDQGHLNEFLHLWKMFQTHIQVTSDDMKKLEVYIRVHFALWPRAHSQPQDIQIEAMNSLKLFFEQHSPGLSGDPAILPLFALPFVSDPFTHPVFKDLFQESWKTKLRSQLESTVLKYFQLLQENICHHSRLAELVVKAEKLEAFKTKDSKEERSSSEASYHIHRFYQLLENHRKIRKLLQGTRESYAKLLLVTNEVVSALEVSIKGDETVSLDPVLEKCYYIFPEIFTPKDSTPTGKPNVDYFKRLTAAASFDPTQDSDVSLFFLGISDLNPESLDYPKVKEALVLENDGGPCQKLCLLQALRWMITKTNEKCRPFAMNAFVANDLLGLTSKKSDFRLKLFHSLLSPTPTYLKECFARLINAFSSTRTGRNYLSVNTFVVDTLIKSLATFNGPNESFICQMVIASLQKLSLKRKMRLYMIGEKVISWLIVYIKSELACEEKVKSTLIGDGQDGEGGSINIIKGGDEVPHFNPYLMEYGWALLMNLCLHEEAWDSCAANGIDILTAAANMLLILPRKDLAPYVVSTLYSLLRSPAMFTLAKSMKIENAFAPLLATESEIGQHLNHLISLLYKHGADRISSSRETNYDDEENPDPDVFEPELELTESWTNSLEEDALWGDDLLLRKYVIQKEEVVVPVPTSQTLEPMTGVIVRPVTPTSKLPTNTTNNNPISQDRCLEKSVTSRKSGGKSRKVLQTDPLNLKGGNMVVLGLGNKSKVTGKSSSTGEPRNNSRTKFTSKSLKNAQSATLTLPKLSSKGSGTKGQGQLQGLSSKKKGHKDSCDEDEVSKGSRYYNTEFFEGKAKQILEEELLEPTAGTMDPGFPVTFDHSK